MKKLVIFLVFVSCAVVIFSPKAHASYSYYRSITVTSTASIASGTLSNFPMLVSSTLSSWESSSTGGSARIQNLCSSPGGSQEPCDLVFTTSTACTNPLNFETESYTSSTGALVDWVNVPTVSTGTVIYACYGNSAITTDQSHPSATWNSNFVLVYHMNQSPTGGAPQIKDSTANGHNATEADSGTNNLTSTSSRIGSGVNFPNNNPYAWLSISSTPSFTNADYSIHVVVNPSNTTHLGAILGTSSTVPGLYMWNNNLFTFYANGGVLQNTTAVSAGNYYWVDATRHYNSVSLIYSKTISLNGNQENTDTNAGGTTDSYPNIGTDGGGSQGFQGIIDEVEISNVQLSTQWILTEYNNQSSPDAAQSSAGFYAVGSEQSSGGGGGTSGEGRILASCYLGRFYKTIIY